MAFSTPPGKPQVQEPPTGDPPARGVPWGQWLKPILVVTFLLRSGVVAGGTRLREDLKDLKADIKKDIANLKTNNEDLKIGIKKDIAATKGDIRALNDKLDRRALGSLTAAKA